MIPKDTRDPFTDPSFHADRRILALEAENAALKERAENAEGKLCAMAIEKKTLENHYLGIEKERDEAVKGKIDKEWALEAVRGRHSLCGDTMFFGEVEKIVRQKKDEAVRAETERCVSAIKKRGYCPCSESMIAAIRSGEGGK